MGKVENYIKEDPLLNNMGLVLAPIFCDGMILQRDTEVSIYGTDYMAESVSILFMGTKYSSKVTESGDFSVKLPPVAAGGPYDVTVVGSKTIRISDVFFGDVYLLAGQSNMELPLRRVMDVSSEEINCTNEPEIRQYVLPATYRFDEPSKYMHSGTWKKAKKDDLMGFSAAGYFFAKEIKDAYHIPVGIILAAVGGSTIEAWMSKEAVEKVSEYNPLVKDFYDLDRFHEFMNQEQKLGMDWLEQLEMNELKGLEGEDFTKWNTCQVPSLVSDYGEISFQGSVYLCREVHLLEEPLHSTSIYMGTIIDSDHIWINGELIGQTGYRYPPRKYPIPEGILKKGKNIILIRIVVNHGNGGTIKGKPYVLCYNHKEITLTGQWHYKIARTAQIPMPKALYPTHLPTGLYHTAIAPLSRVVFLGMLWYQGESNIASPSRYMEKFSEMLCNLRTLFGYEIPCIYVQLPNYQEPLDPRRDSGFAEMRHQQRLCLSLNRVAMITTLDIGESNDLHPQNKKEVGVRLSRAARNLIYGEEDIEYLGPICENAMVRGKEILLTFSHLEDKGDAFILHNFEVADIDQVYYEAKAEKKGKDVTLTCDAVIHPFYVRYAWCDNPININFYNETGLPAAGFRMTLVGK